MINLLLLYSGSWLEQKRFLSYLLISMNNRYSFIGGDRGVWKVTEVRGLLGPSLTMVDRLHVVHESVSKLPANSSWILQGFSINVRYAMQDEVTALKAVQPVLNRSEAISAVLVPIKKSLL
jgi:hypothetical protein